MRVIAGEFRSRKLESVNSDKTRETKDRVKESIFNSITNHLYDAQVLDLFAGSGAMGIEAISRGSKSCVFVDNLNEANKTIKKNVANLKIENQVTIIQDDYYKYLQSCQMQFDVIILDPPYKLEIIDDIIGLIGSNKLLKQSGIIVCLYEKSIELKDENNGIMEYKKKTSGITNISFMKWGV